MAYLLKASGLKRKSNEKNIVFRKLLSDWFFTREKEIFI